MKSGGRCGCVRWGDWCYWDNLNRRQALRLTAAQGWVDVERGIIRKIANGILLVIFVVVVRTVVQALMKKSWSNLGAQPLLTGRA